MDFPDRRTSNKLFTVLAFAVGLAIIYAARLILIIFAFSILFAYLINPLVRFLQRHSLFFKDLKGPHIVEAYLVFLILAVAAAHGLAPEFHKHSGRFLVEISALADRVSTGEIASNLGNNLGLTEGQAVQIRGFLQGHQSNIESFIADTVRFASTVIGGLLVVPILSIFFLSDGENLANRFIQLVSTPDSFEEIHSLAVDLNVALERYIRAKMILGGLSFLYCSIAMLILGFPNALAFGAIAGILEFIPVAGWMLAAASIVSFGVLSHSHWIWMLALLCVWRVLMDYWIAPRVMGRELEIHPLLAIFTMMVGGAVGGIIGIYLSVPLVAMLRVIWDRFSPAARPGLTSPAVVAGSEENMETGTA
jgi:predicted PurR-regulated permease PerM